MSNTDLPIVVPYNEAVVLMLQRLDGTSASAIRLLTDVDDLSNYGGMPDEALGRTESRTDSEDRNFSK